MWFIDHAQITVSAGDGGDGCSAFAQPPYTRYPYPDGGDGGDGGHVSLRADPNVATLLDFQFRHHFQAGRGRHGSGNRKTGRRGDDLVVLVPVGTVVHDDETGVILHDLVRPHEEVIVAKGGRGGLGNASAREATPGRLGERRRIRLELKLIADVGIVGFPNAGKSSLLARISSAHPKVAPFPFTTRYPVLGVVEVEARGVFVACDVPGLIEGAHRGKGLGIQFLRHIERTPLLLHVVDLAAVDGREPCRAFHQLNHELAEYHVSLTSKPQVVAANKMDLPDARSNLAAFRREVSVPVFPISCATGEGVPELLRAVWQALNP